MSKHTPPALEVRRTRCDCHPETCCCPEWELTFHGDVISRGSEEFICRALSKMTGFVRAVNAHEGLVRALDNLLAAAYMSAIKGECFDEDAPAIVAGRAALSAAKE